MVLITSPASSPLTKKRCISDDSLATLLPPAPPATNEESRAGAARPLPPVHRLPLELLFEIFTLAIEQPFNVFIGGAWTLGRVCRIWRQAAWSCPALWTSFWVPRLSFYKETASIALLSSVLQRSGCAGLAFAVDFDYLCGSHKPLVECLLPHISRWKSASFIHAKPDAIVSSFSELVRPQPFQLISLSLGFTGPMYSNSTITEACNVFREAPRLRTLRLSVPHQIFWPVSIQLPWAQLTHLVLDLRKSGTVDKCIDALALCRRIEVFEDQTTDMVWNNVNTSIVTLPTMRSLHLRNSCIIKYLTCPSLDALTLPSYVFNVNTSMALKMMQQRSRFQVQKFCLILTQDPRFRWPISRVLPIPVFSETEELVIDLRYLKSWDNLNQLFEHIAFDGFPKMRSLTIKTQWVFIAEESCIACDSALVDLIEYRWQAVEPRLRTLRIEGENVARGL
ncbi:uncharacterized protein BT62DRAFT_928635 [Guyanagaster necrorhizus]|uniref:F-box domain-containing protein n=1 Tax=Guyanagaster necrorhizus TaxID=856835 RepID=A0A9P7VZ73_9AGAR|nr:uncharacterized protein BT62DRAFT_928635 [Guyanagaster necrorhizus MCA 3950]KAG7449878.1 hypothetical protein BT62DRAFT_928635 [Guyanagaster necrorhizus MCA 3950]